MRRHTYVFYLNPHNLIPQMAYTLLCIFNDDVLPSTTLSDFVAHRPDSDSELTMTCLLVVNLRVRYMYMTRLSLVLADACAVWCLRRGRYVPGRAALSGRVVAAAAGTESGRSPHRSRPATARERSCLWHGEIPAGAALPGVLQTGESRYVLRTGESQNVSCSYFHPTLLPGTALLIQSTV